MVQQPDPWVMFPHANWRGSYEGGSRRWRQPSTLDPIRRCDYTVITIMKTRLVRIGNSRGIRLPKPVIEEAGLVDEVELRVRPGAIVIAPAAGPRAGWAEAAQRLRERGGDGLLEPATPTRFDDQAWTW